MEIWFKVLEKSWKSIGQHVCKPCEQTEQKKIDRKRRERELFSYTITSSTYEMMNPPGHC